MAHWHPLAISLLGAPADLDIFRKDVKARGGLSNWISCNVRPEQYADLAKAVGRHDLLAAVGEFGAAAQNAKAHVVHRIPIGTILPR
jgi:hypothetical protein